MELRYSKQKGSLMPKKIKKIVKFFGWHWKSKFSEIYFIIYKFSGQIYLRRVGSGVGGGGGG